MPVIHLARKRLRDEARRIARRQGGVLTRRQLYALGITRAEVRAEVQARRWKRLGDQCLLVDAADAYTNWWRAVFEVAPCAVLDGISALQAAGLKTISSDAVHVAVPRSSRPRRCRGVQVHETRRYRHEDVIRAGIPRMKPATATVHAALWARTDAEASLLVIAAVQQRLVSVPDLAGAIALVKRHKRRRLLRDLLIDVSEGVQALGEREFASACRRRGFPEPDRQELVRLPTGRVYYDTSWKRYGVKVEIHGAQHLEVAAAARDALKANAASLSGAVILCIPNHALRTDPGPFLDQVEAALRAGGWAGAKSPATSEELAVRAANSSDARG